MANELTKETAKPDPTLTALQLRAITALIEQPSMEKAAKQAHVGRSTLYRWLEIPAFRLELERGQRFVWASALGKLQGAAGQAVKRLIEGLNVRRKTERRLAAAQILDLGFKAQEAAEFAARLSAIEEATGSVAEGGRFSITAMQKSLKLTVGDKKP